MVRSLNGGIANTTNIYTTLGFTVLKEVSFGSQNVLKKLQLDPKMF